EVVDDAVGAENVARFAGDFEGDADVVHLEHGDVSRVNFSGVLEAADMHGEKLGFDDFGDHPCQLFLNKLVRGDGLVGELLARFGILQRSVVTSHGRSDGAPTDAVPGLIEAAERTAKSGYAGKKIFFGDFAIGEG